MKECAVNKNELPNNTVSLTSSFQERQRFDVSLCVTNITYRVETVQCVETGFSQSAKMEDGPARYKVKWEAIAQIALLVVGTYFFCRALFGVCGVRLPCQETLLEKQKRRRSSNWILLLHTVTFIY
jgi:hypothetical protein